MSTDWEDHARRELGPKMASSAFVITINPSDIDPKVALETGYAILLDKPILVLVPVGTTLNPGLRRIATRTVILTEGLDSLSSQAAIQGALAEMDAERPA